MSIEHKKIKINPHDYGRALKENISCSKNKKRTSTNDNKKSQKRRLSVFRSY